MLQLQLARVVAEASLEEIGEIDPEDEFMINDLAQTARDLHKANGVSIDCCESIRILHVHVKKLLCIN